METRILMLEKGDEEKKIESEVKYWLSLTTKQRFEKMFQMSKAAIKACNNRKGKK